MSDQRLWDEIEKLKKKSDRLKTQESGVWTVYSVVWTAATTNPAIGNGTLVGRYARIGKSVTYGVRLKAGSTTTFGSGVWYFSLPFQAVNNTVLYCGSFHIYDAGTTRYSGIALVSPNETEITRFARDNTGAWQLHSTNPMTWAENDELDFTITYEI